MERERESQGGGRKLLPALYNSNYMENCTPRREEGGELWGAI
uniref:Uncharacterized protein n=1 Tax=Arundo donax TaxID=35708 RepID=A0A0A9GLT6_ARUDO